MSSDTLFPLTLSLSLRERERQGTSGAVPNGARFGERRATALALHKRRGGKKGSLQRRVCVLARSPT
jgi:hypothetical protein